MILFIPKLKFECHDSPLTTPACDAQPSQAGCTGCASLRCSPVDPAPAADGQKDRSLSFVCPIPSTQRHMGRSTLTISRELMREQGASTKLMCVLHCFVQDPMPSCNSKGSCTCCTSWREPCKVLIYNEMSQYHFIIPHLLTHSSLSYI